MAELRKSSFKEDLDKYQVFISDTEPDSKYFKITELPDTFTGGKNAFLVAGSEYLVPDTLVKIEIKDSVGNVIYSEPGEGIVSSSINGEAVVTEYYEGISKVVAVYIYPDTTYGPCTITILGEASSYDNNGITTPVPVNWQGAYNVKWQRQINVNPALPNTTKIRFYRRPQASITEILSPIYRIESGSKVNSGVSQSFAEIKLSNLETFAGDVKRVKVFRTSQGDISDYDLIQDILVESKELLTSYNLSGSVVGQTGIFTSETLQNFWNTGSLKAELTSSRVESGLKLSGSGYFTYTSSLDIKSNNTYELNLDAFYSSSTSSNLGIYLSQVTTSMENNVEVPIVISSSIATLVGTQPTKNLLDTTIPFKLDRNYPTASLYFSQSRGEWHLGNVSLKLSQETAFSPDQISFITTMPTIIGNETYNFKFEFYDVNNNYVPVFVTGSGTFTGGNTGQLLRSLTFDSDRTAFRFSTGSFGNPAFQQVGFKISKQNLTGSVTYGSSSYDVFGNYIEPSNFTASNGTILQYPGRLTNTSDAGATLTIANFSGSISSSILIGSIVYTASCDGLEQYETIYRFEDGDNAPGVFVTANTNQFIYKATDLSLNPSGQVITIEAKRKNLASTSGSLTVHSGSQYGTASYLELISDNSTTGVATYSLIGANFNYTSGSATYSISGSDQFGNVFSDSIKISPVKILDGFSVAVSNENTSFPAYSTGNVFGGFAASSGSITVKVGNEVINYSSSSVTNSFSASIASTSNLIANAFNGVDYSINTLSADSGSLTLLVKYKDGGGTIISSSKEITYSKVKKAAPILNFIIGNNNQSVTAKSTGAQIDSFLTASFNVLETYDGVVTSKPLTITKINTTNSYATGSTTSTTLALPNITDNNVNSVDISITGSVVDSETTPRNVFGNISLAKVKKAVPNVILTATPQTQTVAATSQSVQTGTLSTVALDALEGATSVFNSASIISGSSNFTGASISTKTLTLGTIGNSISAASASISINYTDSEGTTANNTINVSAVKAVAGNVGEKGTDGANGASGSDGRRTATGQVYYQTTTGSAPPKPTATSYTFSTNTFATPTLASEGWAVGAPTYAAGNTNKYWYSTFTAVETTAGGGTAVPTFSTPAQAINFTGLVTFTTTDIISDGTNTSTIVPSGSITNHIGGANVTTINGGRISTGVITSTGYTLGGSDTLASGSYTAGGTIFNLDNGSLRSKNFYISSAGDAFFKGNITAGSITTGLGYTPPTTTDVNNASKTSGFVGGWTVDNDAIYSGTKDVSGYSTTGITLYSGGSIHAKNFYIDTSGNSFFKGEVTALSGFIGSGSVGFAINNTYFRNGTKTTFNGAGTGVYIGTDGIGLDTAFTVSSAGVLNATSAIITGNITATNITATTAGNIAGWNVGPTTLGTSKIKLNSSRPAIEIYDANNEIAVDINNQASLTPRVAGTTVISSQTYATTSSIEFNDDSQTTEPYVYQVDITDNPLYSTGGTPISFVPSVTGTYNATINLGGLISRTQGSLEPNNVSPNPVYNNLSATYTIGVSIRSGTINGTEVANFASFTSYSDNTISASFFSRSSTPNSVLIGTINVTGGTTYFIIPYIANGEVSATITNGNLDSQELKVRYNTPTITAVSIAKPVSKSELVAGGFQVIFNTDRWIQIERANNTDFVSIGGGLIATGDITANSSDIRLKENIRIIENPLEKIENIRGVYFNYTEEAKLKTGYTNGEEQIGFIAQEVQKVLPHIVKPAPFDKDQSTGKSISGENYLTIQYEKVVPLLLEGIKELKREIEELKKNK